MAIALGFALALSRPRMLDLWWAVVLVGISVAWLTLDAPFEGRTLWALTARHGLTTADLQAVSALEEAIGLAARYRRSRRPGSRRR